MASAATRENRRTIPVPEKYRESTDDNDYTTETKSDRLLSERTLYEVLGASQDATRDELKERYVTLARASHPDAMVDKSNEYREKNEVLFTEVAAAWRILSDKRERKRYDRSLKAKAFTQEVEKVAGELLNSVAMPFFRKTAGNIKETRVNGENKISIGEAIGSAVKAGQEVVDRYELLKKSRELEEQ